MNWQPIETAPKDGTEILVWCAQFKCAVVVAWTVSVWVPCGGAWVGEENRSDTTEWPATHWMPLPEPPQ